MASTLEAIHVSSSALPIIDIGGLSSGSGIDRKAVAERLRAACLDNGFLYIVNHGVPAQPITALFEGPRRFFASPTPLESAVENTLAPRQRGFEPILAHH